MGSFVDIDNCGQVVSHVDISWIKPGPKQKMFLVISGIISSLLRPYYRHNNHRRFLKWAQTKQSRNPANISLKELSESSGSDFQLIGCPAATFFGTNWSKMLRICGAVQKNTHPCCTLYAEAAVT